MAENTGCVPAFSNGKGVSCNNIPLREMELRFQQDPQVRTSHIMQSVLIDTTEHSDNPFDGVVLSHPSVE